MSNTPKIIIVLTLITLISGAVLALLDSYTRPKIDNYRKIQENQAIAEVLPENDRINEVAKDGYVFYEAYRKHELVGVAFQVSGGGYQSELVLMLGLSPDFSRIIGLKILSQVETPGLGTKIEKDESNKEDPGWFINQFKDLRTLPSISYVKNASPSRDTEIQAISGATVSSKAIVDILNTHIKKAKAARGIE
ncbi:MAG: FMN-binding protein [Candidatus Neomarinimicrobiota bacterium]|jgi:electron transport complex protein RnfG|nr:FMN-binding protein [Candidatus Neomarinimicrobiota bacterium]MDD3966724.1 FMN-binding protein [Candidatus Neomarinimicrobiota bacterium]MDX9780484.1 FMN-binding protein [bacterium]